MDSVNWGILGPGTIAKAFCRGCASVPEARLVAVGSRSADRAAAFAREWGIPNAHASYEALLADKAVQAVYIATPHPVHAEWAIRAADAGKHVLVEKPLAVNGAEALMMVKAAEKNGVFFMEAFMYRCHPQTAMLADLLHNRAIGDVCVIQAAFSFLSKFSPGSRLWNNGLAGGGILDVGCYPVSMSRLIAGAATGRPFADPISVAGHAKLNPTSGVDEYAVGTMAFPGGIVATVATGVGVSQENVVRVFGTEGSIFIPTPWVSAREDGTNARIMVTRKDAKQTREIVCDTQRTSFALEAEAASRAILAGRREATPPAMTPADSIGNIRALDSWRAAVGLVYDMEKA